MINIRNLSSEEVKKQLTSLDYENYRTEQIFNWLYIKGVKDFGRMTDLPLRMRKKLNDLFYIPELLLLDKREADDGSIKFLFELPDGEYIESVYIPENKRNTLCISTQIGCGMGCEFCATGKMGFIRNLELWEITEQILEVRRILKKDISNVVFMGMGEPLANPENVSEAIKIINDQIDIGARKITLSTVGLVPEIYKISKIPIQFRLAISLNATTDKLRNKIMPINKKYPIDKLIEAGRYYAKEKNLPVTFEYILFENLNDKKEDAERLIDLTRNLPCKINLIPYNPISSNNYKRPCKAKIKEFQNLLEPASSIVTIRWSSGNEINAACGQLRAKY